MVILSSTKHKIDMIEKAANRLPFL